MDKYGWKFPYQYEVAFFAVGEAYRGMGIGKKLFESLLLQMRREQVKDFYLFTDTSCNYGFYEHQGMIRRGRRHHIYRYTGKEMDFCFFLYDLHMFQSVT